MDFPASVANKRLTAGLSPLDATLTKNTRGWGAHVLSTFSSPLCFLALTKCKFSNSFVLIFMQIGGGCSVCSQHSNLQTFNMLTVLPSSIRVPPLAFSPPMYSIYSAPSGLVRLRAATGFKNTHGQRRQWSKSRGHASGRLSVSPHAQHRPQNYRAQLPVAGTVQRFSGHGDVVAHAHPLGLAGDASPAALQSRRFAGSFCCAHHAAWFADGFSGAHCGAAGRIRKLFSAAANWRARSGFPHA